MEVSMTDEHYRLTIDGISGLMMNNNLALLEGEDKGRDPARYEREHFKEKAYTNGDGKSLIIPARAIKKTLQEACKFYPAKPKGTAFKSFGPFIQAAALFPNDATLIGKTLDNLMPVTLVVSLDPSKGNKSPRGPRTRPLLPLAWQAVCDFIVFDPILTKEVLTEITQRAGLQVG